MARIITALALMLAIASPAVLAVDGVIVKESRNSVGETVDKLEAIVRDKGFGVVAKVNHAAAAQKAGLSLRPTQVLIFGNPKVGTALMSSAQTIGLDLPIRVAVWEDEAGKVWIGYHDPAALTARHGIADRSEVVQKMTGALANFTDAAGS